MSSAVVETGTLRVKNIAGQSITILKAPLPEIANLSMKYFILSNVYTDKGGTTVCPPVQEDTSLTSARGLSPRTDGQTMV